MFDPADEIKKGLDALKGLSDEESEKFMDEAAEALYERFVKTDLRAQRRHDDIISLVRQRLGLYDLDTFDPAAVNAFEAASEIFQMLNLMALSQYRDEVQYAMVLSHLQTINDMLLLIIRSLRRSAGQSLPDFDSKEL